EVKEGRGEVVLLTGEAGIGKSRLVQVLKSRADEEAHLRLEGRGSPYHQNTALYPVIDLLSRVLDVGSETSDDAKLARLETVLADNGLSTTESVPVPASPPGV